MDAKNDLKISDFGLSEDVYTTEYFRQKEAVTLHYNSLASSLLHLKYEEENNCVLEKQQTALECFSYTSLHIKLMWFVQAYIQITILSLLHFLVSNM